MVIFLDTSAIYALADQNDIHHPRAKKLFNEALENEIGFFLHNYILLESSALLTRRLGWQVTERFLSESETFQTIWVDELLHHKAVRQWRQRNIKNISLVDQVSFLVMQEMNAVTAFTFDSDFSKEGFKVYGSK